MTTNNDNSTLAAEVAVAAEPIRDRQPKLKETQIGSLSDFLSAIKEFSSKSGPTWFRGQSDRKYKLTPGLFRHKDIVSNPDPHVRAQEIESSLVERFRNQSVPYVGSKFSHEDEWGQLFFMQHYRIPTRLLDWSYSPLVALHFALFSQDPQKRPAEACAVWVLHPEIWNGAALAHQRAPKLIYGTSSTESQSYKTSTAYKVRNADAIGIEGIHNSPRIVAQQGVFTIFGSTTLPLEDQFQSNQYPEEALSVITIARDSIEKLRTEIVHAGIVETTIYPDLEGLASRLRRELSF